MYHRTDSMVAEVDTDALHEVEEVVIAMATLVEAAGGARQAQQQGLFERFDGWFGRAQQIVHDQAISDPEVVWQQLVQKASHLPLSPAARHVLEAVSAVDHK